MLSVRTIAKKTILLRPMTPYGWLFPWSISSRNSSFGPKLIYDASGEVGALILTSHIGLEQEISKHFSKKGDLYLFNIRRSVIDHNVWEKHIELERQHGDKITDHEKRLGILPIFYGHVLSGAFQLNNHRLVPHRETLISWANQFESDEKIMPQILGNEERKELTHYQDKVEGRFCIVMPLK